ncbi:MAG: putative diguanylate cyclase DgcQ [Syntrophus sp. SKADARSKE-3]|nr:putative diguanylate cyclase DgcQ [Syntrophus sp. SKADARSKE-3]
MIGFGHDRGDDVLIHVSSIFTELSRETDIIARYAGDEFVLILPGVSLPETEAVMERLKIELKDRPLSINGQNVTVRFSYGMAGADEAASADEFLRNADIELYAAKKKKS